MGKWGIGELVNLGIGEMIIVFLVYFLGFLSGLFGICKANLPC
jgi:hypothetical protein